MKVVVIDAIVQKRMARMVIGDNVRKTDGVTGNW